MLTKGKKLVILGIAIEIIILFFYVIEFFLRDYFHDSGLVLSHFYLRLGIVIILLFWMLLYYFAFRLIDEDKKYLKIIIYFLLIFSFTLLFLWPNRSIDIFSYIGWGRVLSIYHANTYMVPYMEFRNDSFYHIINNQWLKMPSPYGPLFVFFTSFTTYLGGNNLILNLFVIKFFFLLFNIINCYLIHKSFNNHKVTLLYGWNPLILFEFVLNGHSDVMMITLFLVGFYLIKRSNNFNNLLLAFYFLFLSIFVKFILIVLFPVFLFFIFSLIKDTKRKLLFTFYLLVICLITAFVFYFPFWQGIDTFNSVLSYANNLSGDLILNIHSPLIPFIFIVLSYIDINTIYIYAVQISRIIFFIFYIISLLLFLRNSQDINLERTIKYSLFIILGLFLLCMNWIYPWYLIILIVLNILYYALTKKYDSFILVIITFAILIYIFTV